jgi:hypothetical protein
MLLNGIPETTRNVPVQRSGYVRPGQTPDDMRYPVSAGLRNNTPPGFIISPRASTFGSVISPASLSKAVVPMFQRATSNMFTAPAPSTALTRYTGTGKTIDSAFRTTSNKTLDAVLKAIRPTPAVIDIPPPVTNPSGSAPAAAANAAASLPSGGGGGGGGGGGYVEPETDAAPVDNSLMGKFSRLPGIAKVAIFAGGAGGVYLIYRTVRGGRSAAGKSA